MYDSVDAWIDVSDIAGLGETLRTRVTVTYPVSGCAGERPVVCFGFPGGGYSRGYFTFDMPDSADGGQAGWHAARGWVFVGCDHLYVGDSDAPSSAAEVGLEAMAAVNAATVEAVTEMLVKGTLAAELAPLEDPVRVGVGHSMGGSMVVVQQGRHRTFDAVAVLGSSARHVVPAQEPGTEVLPQAYLARGSTIPVSSTTATSEIAVFRERPDGLPLPTWVFHHDDVPADIVERDMRDWPARRGGLPPWASATMPPVTMSLVTPGVILLEAFLIDVPVFVGYGERDLSPRPELEPQCYENSPDITLYRCPRMAHMHNFAGTRHRLWTRLHAWGDGVAAGLAG